MPANLTPDYLAAERRYKEAKSLPEKVAALEDMLATVPKHKGTEKLQADIKHRLAQTRKESQKRGAHATPAYLIKREGAGQVALIGPPNSGKSRLLCALTHARPDVAEYPYTTRLPIPGMMPFEDVHIQLVDTPAISREFTEPWMGQLVRQANANALVIDPNDPDVLGDIDYVLAMLEEWKTLRPALLVSNKLDLAGGDANFAAVRELYCDQFRCLGVSAATGAGLSEFAQEAFRALRVVRFYSRPPGKKPDLATPYILKRGETVQDAAAHLHRDFAEHLKYARLFRKSHEHDGLMVERTHVVEDEDILEFHM